jgi:hypothetical protein
VLNLEVSDLPVVLDGTLKTIKKQITGECSMNRIFTTLARFAAGVIVAGCTTCFAASFSGHVIVNLYAPENGGDFAGGPGLDSVQSTISGSAGVSQDNTPWANQQPAFTTIHVGTIGGWAGGIGGAGGELTMYSHATGPAFEIWNPHDVFASVFVPYDYTYVIEANADDPGDSAFAEVLINITGYGKQKWIEETVTNGTLACLICTGTISFVLPPNSTSTVRVQDAQIRGRAFSDGILEQVEIPIEEVPIPAHTPEPSAALLAGAGLLLVALGKLRAAS